MTKENCQVFFFCLNPDTRRMPKNSDNIDISWHYKSHFLNTCFSALAKVSIKSFSLRRTYEKNHHVFPGSIPDRPKKPRTLSLSTDLFPETHYSPKLSAWIFPSRAQSTALNLRINEWRNRGFWSLRRISDIPNTDINFDISRYSSSNLARPIGLISSIKV